ncbi:MAG: cysteine hydrolase [Clostridia bacterium]|nr:cysteine hydrolase [Clostridia bacterium]
MILLIVDAQTKIVTRELYDYERFVENVQRLIFTARENGVEVVYIRHDDGTELTKGVDGFEIFKAFAPQPNEKIFDKTVNSAFKSSGLNEYLRSKNEKTVMIAGLQTDYCIDATIKCGFEHNFEMLVPAHCNTTLDNEHMTAEQSYKYYNEKMWNARYAKCINMQAAIDMLGGNL